MRMTSILAGFLLVSAPAVAGSFDVSGVGQGMSHSETMPVSDDMVVVHAKTDYTGFASDIPDNPMAGLTGPCFGAILVNAGKPSGTGYCNYADADGNAAVFRWEAEAMNADGRLQGSWTLVGGTGPWAGGAGSGTFDAGTGADGVYTNMVTGEVTLP